MKQSCGQVRLGMGACVRAARHSIHFPPVFQGPPSGHPPGIFLAHPHLLKVLINILQPTETTRHVGGPLASTHEASSLRESGEQDQHQENDPHVHTAAADAHGLCRKQISSESPSETSHWTQSPTSESQEFFEGTWYRRS